MKFYKGKFGRTGKMTPRSARRVIKKYVHQKFTKRVQKIVDRSIKNTPTNVIRHPDAICRIVDTSSATRRWYTFVPGIDVFKRNMGGSTSVNYPFEGQSMKIKKWWIKGTICYDAALLATMVLTQSEVGYVDIYLIRNRIGTGPVTELLPNFYQSGVDTLPCNGARAELVWPINANSYKVYAHKRFKMGAAWVRQDGVPAVSLNEMNNDFSYAKTFSFDVTKYVGKNHVVRYLENQETAQDNLLSTLTVLAVFHPACGDIGTPTPGLTGLVYKSAFSVDCVSWGEYETA